MNEQEFKKKNHSDQDLKYKLSQQTQWSRRTVGPESLTVGKISRPDSLLRVGPTDPWSPRADCRQTTMAFFAAALIATTLRR
jgi:hypothetical protein